MQRSRGKGSRRRPWRDGGRKKGLRPDWRKNARHSTDSQADLTPPTETLSLPEFVLRNPVKSIYIFDQEMAAAGIAYHVEHHGSFRGFTVAVAEAAAGRVREILHRLIEQYDSRPPEPEQAD